MWGSTRSLIVLIQMRGGFMGTRSRVLDTVLALVVTVEGCASTRANGAMPSVPQRAGSRDLRRTACSGSVVVHVNNSLAIPVVVRSVSSAGTVSEYSVRSGVSDVTLPPQATFGGVVLDPVGVERQGGTHPTMYYRVSYTTRCEPQT